jgi:signal transduction histidine kinase
MDDGGLLTISTKNGLSSFYKDRPAVKIEVRDTGQGISTEQQGKIFNPFYTTKPTGTGLGLAISHKIMERQGGVLSFESEPGKGATFTVELRAR